MPPLERNSKATKPGISSVVNQGSVPAKPGATARPTAPSKQPAVARRISATRWPLWSATQLEAYGASSRVQLCNEAMAPMARVDMPSAWNHSGG